MKSVRVIQLLTAALESKEPVQISFKSGVYQADLLIESVSDDQITAECSSDLYCFDAEDVEFIVVKNTK